MTGRVLSFHKNSLSAIFGCLLCFCIGGGGLVIRALRLGPAFATQPLSWFFAAVLGVGWIALFFAGENLRSLLLMLTLPLLYQSVDMGYRVFLAFWLDAASGFSRLTTPWWIAVIAARALACVLSLVAVGFLFFPTRWRLRLACRMLAVSAVCFALVPALYYLCSGVVMSVLKYNSFLALSVAALLLLTGVREEIPEREAERPTPAKAEPTPAAAPASEPPEYVVQTDLLIQTNKAAWELIADLCDLKDAGLISQEEYDTKSALVRAYKIDGAPVA